jgi:hypothetical protein
MSLLQLLTTGKSLVGMSDSESRYRMRNRLPRFGSDRNPFATRQEQEGAAGEGGSAEPRRGDLSIAELAAARLKETQRLPAPVAAPRSALPRPSRISRLAAWLRRANQAVRPSRPELAARPLPPAARPGIRPPVQGELSLDKVRVVRNDLSDADLEVVPARPASELPPGTRPQPDLASSRSA